MELDHNLVQQVQRLINGANVHNVKTWIFCYETSLPSSPRREQYERLLRDFVLSKCLSEASNRRIKLQKGELHKMIRASRGINRRLEKLLTSSSD